MMMKSLPVFALALSALLAVSTASSIPASSRWSGTGRSPQSSRSPRASRTPMSSRGSPSSSRSSPSSSGASASPFRRCTGQAKYSLTFSNLLTPARFGSLIPSAGLFFSPPVAVSHSNRVSLLTVRGLASPQVEEIAENGNNAPLVTLARSLESPGLVRSVSTADGPTGPGKSTTLTVTVDCERPFVTMLGMIAPSPDWIVQVSNRNMFSERSSRFVSWSSGDLIAYDAGVDSGREFTDPADPSLDDPTMPPKNIAPLREDDTDRFDGRVVGSYKFKRMN